MQLPNADKAVVDQKKIQEYLLSKTHPDGWSKAQFFSSIGFGLTVIIDNVISRNFSSGAYVLTVVSLNFIGLILLGLLLKEFKIKAIS